MDERKRDIQGVGLSLLNRFAGSEVVDKLGLRKPAEKALYQASKASFGAASMARRRFKSVSQRLRPERMERAGDGGDLFDLTPSDEQAMMQEAARRFAEEVLRPAAHDAEAHAEPSKDVWSAAHELGLAMMAVPEALGGAGAERSAVTSGLVAEQLGWGDPGQACALLAPVGVAHALACWGDAAQQDRYLRAFAEDTPPDAALALLEPAAAFDAAHPGCRAERQGNNWIVTGEKALVPLGPFADLLIVGADCEGLGPRLLLVETRDERVLQTPEPGMGLRAASLGRVQLHGVVLGDDAVLGDADSYAQAIDLARLAWCSLAVGCAQAVLDLVGPYVTERQAFGEPIAYRQGVAFTVADMAIEVDAMRLMTWRALARHDAGLEFHREAVLAHRYCAEHAMQLGSDGVQMLGGHGFVTEYPVERWYRDLRAIANLEGGLLL